MKDALFSWDIPTTRESGLPLPESQIAGVEISLAASGNPSVVIDTVAPPDSTLAVADLDDGAWEVTAVVIDTAGKRSTPVMTPFVSDDSNPSPVTNVQVALS